MLKRSTPTPLNSLEAGRWFKLICGASYQDLPAVRNLALAYALAGADCIDVAADPAAISAARAGLQAAAALAPAARGRGFFPTPQPFLMTSLNDGEDPHFRKAFFDPATCPPACPRPCLSVCPAAAISLTGVSEPSCYGCGRCLPICPHEKIATRTHQLSPVASMELLATSGVGIDAIEIHTQPGRQEEFARLWQAIAPAYGRPNTSLRLLAISCPDGADLIDYLQKLHGTIRASWSGPLIWQTDGRPMSGDIGIGMTNASVKLARKVLTAGPPGYVQLAGGTNQYTVPKLRATALLATPAAESASRTVAGVAYGSYARVSLAPILTQLRDPVAPSLTGAGEALEAVPELLWRAVAIAADLTAQIKAPRTTCTALHDPT